MLVLVLCVRKVYITQTMATKWQNQSGAAKRKAKKQRIASEAKGKRTLEELGWKTIVRQPDCEQDDEISLDTGCSVSVLPAAQLELMQEQPECDSECKEDTIGYGDSDSDSIINSISESDGQDSGGDDLSTGSYIRS